MSRLGFVLFLLLAALLGCASAPLSTDRPADATVWEQPATPPPVPTQRSTQQPKRTIPPSDAEVVVTPLQISKGIGPEAAEPHIALLLPLKSRDFGRAAEMVREGFEAAAAVQYGNSPPIRVYPLEDELDSLLLAYQQSVASGARCVVAGLTRDGALNIATSSRIQIPTLTLNQVDQQSLPAGPFYTLSLSLEDEARQMAKLIFSQGLSRVAVLTGPSALSKRIHQAFEQEWINGGGEVVVRFQLSRDTAEYERFRSALRASDAIFIAAESHLVRQVMPFIARGAPVFATSQVYDGKMSPAATVELQGVRFLDMPWMVDPAHTAVAIYPRSSGAMSAALDRLYALGIDAFRLANILATKDIGTGYMDGVTGTITLRDNYRFQRDLIPVYFDGDQLVPIKLPPP